MQTLTLRVIRDEHQALSAMLRSMGMLLAKSRRESTLPNFEVLRAMLFYVDEFPEKRHHTKEDQLLFPRVRERAPDLGPVIDRLERDHARGEKAIRDLGHTLLAFEVMGESRRGEFEQALETYTHHYLEHMALEEREILPVAQKLFSPTDWAELDAAFAANRDPLTGHDPDDTYRPLFSRIVNHAPAPIGLA